MVDSYYRGANGLLLVYDITNRMSFKCLNSWLIDITNKGNKYMYKILIGNKCDLTDKRKVTYVWIFFKHLPNFVQEAFDKLTSWNFANTWKKIHFKFEVNL